MQWTSVFADVLFIPTIIIQGDDSDCRGHGTHCAGTIAGKVYGVAKQSRVHAIRVLGCYGSGSWASVINGREKNLRTQINASWNCDSIKKQDSMRVYRSENYVLRRQFVAQE